MKKSKGFILIELVIVLLILLLIIIIPIACHQNITRKQRILAQSGVEMSYWDIFWTETEIRFNRGEIKVTDD